MRRFAITMALLLAMGTSSLAAPPAPKVAPAADGIFDAFKTHPLVGLGEWHGLAQELDFYVELLRDPRFARDVGNIVLEVGDAAQQDVIDRYVNGEAVPYPILRKVWADTVGWFPTVTYSGSINIYSTIRDVNAKLPPEQRIKVWLGEPPIDWAATKTKADWDPLAKQRDTYPAELIEREVLAKNKKALVIYGAGHFGIFPPGPNIRMQIDAKHPGALFVVTPYGGYAQKDCAARFERHIKGWPIPSLVTPIRGSTLEKDIWRKGCNPQTKPKDMPQELFELSGRNYLGLTSDALLYLGPRKSLVTGPRDPDIILDLEYRAEMDRRMILRTGKPLGPPDTANNVPRPLFAD
ncbi:MAG TPA: hypothetical protein VN175_12505 [Rhizomicrobium sp.]|nr:hypothetical protein [Rhizomicrobium sp.]